MSINDVLNFKFEIAHFVAIPIIILGAAIVFFIFELIVKVLVVIREWLDKARKGML